MAVVDFYDALKSRVYKAAMAREVASGIIVKDAGTHFGRAIADAFLRCEARFRKSVMPSARRSWTREHRTGKRGHCSFSVRPADDALLTFVNAGASHAGCIADPLL